MIEQILNVDHTQEHVDEHEHECDEFAFLHEPKSVRIAHVNVAINGYVGLKPKRGLGDYAKRVGGDATKEVRLELQREQFAHLGHELEEKEADEQ